MRRATLKASTPLLKGVGIHTGHHVWVAVHPIPSDLAPGVYFKSTADGIAHRVTAESVVSNSRCTTIVVGDRRLSTVEHLMSALNGAGVSDAIVEFHGDEIPILDGSASPFYEAFLAVGVNELHDDLPAFMPKSVIKQTIGDSTIILLPSDHFSATVVIEYPDRPEIGIQAAFYDGSDYGVAIAPARTYGFLSEFEELSVKGLAGGASFENCVALTDSGAADSRTPLRFENELARHKLLDLIGDLALAGLDIKAHVVALKSNHAVNCKLARTLAAEFYLAQG